MNMSAITTLRDKLAARFPDAKLALDLAETPKGSSWLDIRLDDQWFVVEWHKKRGFGLSAPDASDYGAKPDELFEGLDEAFERLKTLLLSGVGTSRPPELELREVREHRSFSQAALAELLSISQGALSRMERRSDMLIGTLRSAIAAMGGQLEIRAVFPEGEIVIKLDGSEIQGEVKHDLAQAAQRSGESKPLIEDERERRTLLRRGASADFARA
jgi:transcriptional regulator with XRE-family HTH domain